MHYCKRCGQVVTLITHIMKRLHAGRDFYLVGYSFGGLVALQLVLLLEQAGYLGKVILIDSSPDFMRLLLEEALPVDLTDHLLQVQVLLRVISLYAPQDTSQLEKMLLILPDWPSKLKGVLENLVDTKRYSKRYQIQTLNAAYYRVKAVLNYKGLEANSISSTVTLLRPTTAITSLAEEDYCLSKYTKSPVQVIFVDGDHQTILDNKRTAEIINKLLETEDEVTFKKAILATPIGTLASIQDTIKHK